MTSPFGAGLAAAPLFELWGEFAEFLQYYSSIRLCIFCSPTSVGLGYGGAGGFQRYFLSSARFLLRARVCLPEQLTAGQIRPSRRRRICAPGGAQVPPPEWGGYRPATPSFISLLNAETSRLPSQGVKRSENHNNFPGLKATPFFCPSHRPKKQIRVLRGRFILELTSRAPETSGFRRQSFALYKTLLMPAFSLPRPPGELALPPSPANGTFHYPTPFPPAPHCAGATCSGDSGENPGWKTAKPRLRYFAQPR